MYTTFQAWGTSAHTSVIAHTYTYIEKGGREEGLGEKEGKGDSL